MAKSKVIELKDVHEELRASNRLTILSLVMNGVKQSDIAATLDVSDSVVSEMFPKGVLKRLAKKSAVANPVKGQVVR